MRSNKFTAGLLIASLLLFVSMANLHLGRLFDTTTRAGAVKPRKLSGELQDAVAERPNDRVRVIVQTGAAAAKSFTAAVTNSGGKVSKSYKNLPVVALELPARAVAGMASRSDVKYLSLDKNVTVTGHLETTTGTDQARTSAGGGPVQIDGSGIGIAILDSGIDPSHHAFLDAGMQSRIVASVDFTGEGRTDDPYGHGTHVAAVAAGNSHVSGGAYTGIAPAARLINVRVLGAQGQGSIADALAGIDWCISNKDAYNIRVLNMSFGAVAVDSYVNDPLCLAVRQAFNAGLVVCVASGNLGKDENGNKIYGAVHSPGVEPSAITVGATNTFGTDARSDDVVASYSSRGPTRGYYTDENEVRHYDNLIKPDLVAPGNKIIEAESPGNYIVTSNPGLDANVSTNAAHAMMRMSGTSMATPVVAGAAALLLQRNPALTPNLAKALLQYTAQPIQGANNFEQGAGQLNVEGAIRLAGLIRTDLSSLSLGDPLLSGAQPAQSSAIAGESFAWGGGIIQKWNFIYGQDLIASYQGIYSPGVVLSDGVLLSSGVLVADGVLLSSGTLMSSGVLVADGVMLADGVLISDGVMLADGVLVSDGVLISDGVLVSDSTLADSTTASAMFTIAQTAMSGDNTSSMAPAPDRSHKEW
jgi:serine protease AprX